MLSCIIIDDEIHAIEALKKYVSAIPELEVVDTYTDPLKALSALRVSKPVDLILMDVDMPGISGIELSREIRNKTDKLVITTSHTKYGYEAFEVAADAYLLKPFSLGKFLITISKLFPTSAECEEQDKIDKDFFFVRSKEDQNLVRIRYKDVIVVESKLNYVKIHTTEKNILTYMPLNEIAKALNTSNGFIRFQRSFIMGQDHIESIEGNTIKMTNDQKITVGEYYRKDFHDFVNERLIKAKRKG